MAQKVGVLSTVVDGQPYSACMYYIADEDFSVYFVTTTHSQKHQNIQENNHVAFCVADLKSMRTIQLQGKVEKVEDKNMLQAVVDTYIDIASDQMKYAAPITKLDWKAGLIVYHIVPTWLRFADFKDSKSKKNQSPYTVLIE